MSPHPYLIDLIISVLLAICTLIALKVTESIPLIFSKKFPYLKSNKKGTILIIVWLVTLLISLYKDNKSSIILTSNSLRYDSLFLAVKKAGYGYNSVTNEITRNNYNNNNNSLNQIIERTLANTTKKEVPSLKIESKFTITSPVQKDQQQIDFQLYKDGRLPFYYQFNINIFNDSKYNVRNLKISITYAYGSEFKVFNLNPTILAEQTCPIVYQKSTKLRVNVTNWDTIITNESNKYKKPISLIVNYEND